MIEAEISNAVGFVIYKPELDFYERISLLLNSGIHVYVFDNYPHKSKEILDQFIIKELHYFSSLKNVGLGLGISSICYNAYTNGAKSLLFFDQDTIFSMKTIAYVKSYLNTKADEFRNYAAIQFCSSTSVNVSRGNAIIVKQKPLIISSGSLFNLDNVSHMNYHNKDFFVDGVDYEFCFRASGYGYSLGLCDGAPELDHISGQEDQEYYFLRKKFRLRAYSNSRLRDSLGAYFRLVLSSIVKGDKRYLWLFLKSLCVFVMFQVLVRLLNMIKHD